MQINFKENILPHFLGIFSFYLIVLLYFSPIVFEDKMMFQTDILQWEGSAREILDHQEATGEEALWTNRMFGGMPAYLIHIKPKGDITNMLTAILTFGLPHPVNALFFGMVSMYILLLSLKVRPEISVAGSWAFAFNTFNFLSLEAGHNAKIWAICIIPLIIAGIHLAFTGKRLLGLAVAALAVMLQLKFNHLQITYYTLLLVVIYGIGQLVHATNTQNLPEFGKTAAILLLAAFIGVAGNSARLASVMEYGKYSTRGENNLENGGTGLDKDYAFHWSQGKMESLTLLIPNFYGGASSQPLPKGSESEKALRAQGLEAAQINEFIKGAPTYWGDQPGTGGPIYGGAIMIFLFVIGILFAPPLYRNMFIAMALLTLALSWGKNLAWFNYTLFDYLPGYNKFRAASMALGITLFTVPVLGCLGLEHLMGNIKSHKTKQSFLVALGITIGVILLGVVLASWMGYKGAAEGAFPDWLQEALRSDRRKMLQSDAFRSTIFIALSAALIFAVISQKIKSHWALTGIALLVLIDVWGINRRYLDQDSFIHNPSQQYFAATPADQKIMADQEYYRVLNLQNPFNEARTSYRFNSIGGYHGAKMSRYQDLIERAINPEINQFIQKAQEGDFDFESIHVLNMLNTRYIMAGRSENAVFQNPMANGPAWFPSEIIPVASNEEEISTLTSLDTKQKATLSSKTVNPGNGTLQLQSYEPGRLEYHAEVLQSGLAVFSEIYYPEGWKAFINGDESEILRVNYLLRGLVLPEGNSHVVFEFSPKGYFTTSMVMTIFQYIVVILIGAGVFITFKKKK